MCPRCGESRVTAILAEGEEEEQEVEGEEEEVEGVASMVDCACMEVVWASVTEEEEEAEREAGWAAGNDVGLALPFKSLWLICSRRVGSERDLFMLAGRRARSTVMRSRASYWGWKGKKEGAEEAIEARTNTQRKR